MQAGGVAGDWINHELGIPTAESELGDWSMYNEFWYPTTDKKALEILNQNLNWLEHTYEKMGN